jgi:peptidoglycan-associated lipoprotein
MKIRFGSILVICILLASCGPEKKAAKNFKMGKYQRVIEYYTDVLEKQPNNPKANYYVAESFRLSNRIKQSEAFYAKASGPGVNSDSVKLYYSKALQSLGKYVDAKKVLEELQASTRDEVIKARAVKELDALHRVDDLAEKKNYYKIKNLDAVNTPYTEYAPSYLNGELYFTSSRNNQRIYEATATPYTDIFKATSRGAVVDVNTVAPLPVAINAENINEGCVQKVILANAKVPLMWISTCRASAMDNGPSPHQ